LGQVSHFASLLLAVRSGVGIAPSDLRKVPRIAAFFADCASELRPRAERNGTTPGALSRPLVRLLIDPTGAIAKGRATVLPRVRAWRRPHARRGEKQGAADRASLKFPHEFGR